MYEYLYRCIRKDIRAGRFLAGYRLPSKRSLAEQLCVSVITVQNAYAQLIAEGYVYTKEKRGYYVAAPEERAESNRAFSAAAFCVKKGENGEGPGPDTAFLDLQRGGTSLHGFPFTVWTRLLRQVLSEEGRRILEPCPFNGVHCLRRAICDYLYRMRGMEVSPDQILIGAGAQYLYDLLIRLLGFSRVYALEDPCYPRTPMVYRANGIEPVFLPLDEGGVCMDALEQSGAEILHLSPSHHFPTGLVTGFQRRQALLRYVEEKEERYIIEDDYDSEFRFSGRPIEAMQHLDKHGRVIYMNTFTKSIAPSIRIAYMVLPEALMERFQKQLGFYACTVPGIEQYTLARFIEEGHFERHIARTKKLYKDQRDRVIRAIEKSAFGPFARILEADAGLHFLLELDTERSDAEIVGICEQAGIRVSCLGDYLQRPDPRYARRLLINYANIDCEKLPEAFSRLEKAFGLSTQRIHIPPVY